MAWSGVLSAQITPQFVLLFRQFVGPTLFDATAVLMKHTLTHTYTPTARGQIYF